MNQRCYIYGIFAANFKLIKWPIDTACGKDGKCYDTDDDNDPNRSQTVCGPNDDPGACVSCTYKNCCHVSFVNPQKCCKIDGWRASNYAPTDC